MKMYLYEVSEQISIEDVINNIRDREMKERVKPISDYTMKLEEIERTPESDSKMFLMDFCKHRASGPGRAKKDEKIKGFDLGEDEAFGEMTAALYDPKTHFIIIQYNHYGPRAGAIADYLSSFNNGSNGPFLFQPRLRNDVLAEIDKKQYNHLLSFALSPANLTEAHKNKLGMGIIIDNLAILGGNIGEIQITLKKKRGKYGKMENQKSFLRGIYEIFQSDSQDAIKSAKVSGSMTPEDAPEILDILNAKIFQEFDGLIVDKKTKLYSFNSRCKLLIKAFKIWKESGIITSKLR